MGFFGAMFLIFMTLKLAGVIDWPWWWVTAPLWWPFAGLAVAFVAAMVALSIKWCVVEPFVRARRRRRLRRLDRP